MEEQIKSIISAIITGVSIIYSIIVSIINLKSKKSRANCSYTKSVPTLFEILNNNLMNYMEIAEKTFNSLGLSSTQTSVMKHQDVVNKIKIDCLTNNVEYDETIVNDKIEELIKFSKEVNK